ncbi:MAG: adenine phosphoribosyltransferase [Myxococcota bacterium]
MSTSNSEWAISRIRTIPDFPKAGIQFRDITTLFADPLGFRKSVDELVQPFVSSAVTKVLGIESRGFILGGAIAHQLSVGFVPARKPGKLPGEAIHEDYALEYGTDRLEIHTDALAPGDSVLIVDDLIATGGTATAAANLVEKAGATVHACCFVIDLPDLGGSNRLMERGLKVVSLCEFEGD